MKEVVTFRAETKEIFDEELTRVVNDGAEILKIDIATISNPNRRYESFIYTAVIMRNLED